jgi:hypothetical protein
MAEGAFDDPKRKPISTDIERELGRSWLAWNSLTSWLSEDFSSLTDEWRFTGEQCGWSLRIKRKKRTIIYLLPCRKYFRVTLILGDKAVKKALQSALPNSLVKEIRLAKKYPEGRVLRFEIRFKEELPTLMQLVDAKMST